MLQRKTLKKPVFFLVWKEGSDCTTPTHKHHSYNSAKAECKRLTSLYGGQFHILAHVSTATKQDVIFEELQNVKGDIPF